MSGVYSPPIQVLMSREQKWKCMQIHYRKMDKAFQNGVVNVLSTYVWHIGDASSKNLYPHIRSDLCLLVKRRQPVQQTILQSFSGLTWTAIAVSLAAFAGSLRLIGRRDVLLEVLDAFINGGFVTRESDRRGNFLFLLLSAFGMVIVSAFTGTFMGFLAVIMPPRQVQTLEEAASYVTKVCGYPTLESSFEDVDRSDVVWKLFEKLEICHEGSEYWSLAHDEYLRRPQEPGPGFVQTELQQALKLHDPRLWDNSTDTSFAHKVPECLFTPTFLSFNVRLKERQKRRLDAHLSAIMEGGIYAKILSIVWMNWRKMEKVRRGPALSSAFTAVPPFSAPDPRPLKISALEEPAIILAVGLLAAAVAFLVEMALRMRDNGCCKPGPRLLYFRRNAPNCLCWRRE